MKTVYTLQCNGTAAVTVTATAYCRPPTSVTDSAQAVHPPTTCQL